MLLGSTKPALTENAYMLCYKQREKPAVSCFSVQAVE